LVPAQPRDAVCAWPGGADLDPSVIYAALDLGPDKAQIKVLAPSIAA
jgi:hypothetical protein